MSLLLWFLLVYYILQSSVALYIIHETHSKYFKAYRSLKKETKEKYFMYYRRESETLSEFSMMLSALTWGGVKIAILFWATAAWNITRVITLGADVNKPYSKFRKFILFHINNVYMRTCMFCYGYYYIKVIKKRIQDFDPDYPEQNTPIVEKKPTLVVCNHSGICDG